MKNLATSRPLALGLGSILFIVLLAGGLSLAFALHGSPHAFAAPLQSKTEGTCTQQPTMEHCNGQDPELQGCAADATTLGPPAALIDENGTSVGSIERRWSARCRSWWGRVFDTRPGSQEQMAVTMDGATIFSSPPTFVSNQYRILYSYMIFEASDTQTVPAVTGYVGAGNGRLISATLPAITIPGN